MVRRMGTLTAPSSWSDLYDAWVRSCTALGGVRLCGWSMFEDVAINDPARGDERRLNPIIIDWWPRAQLGYRARQLELKGVAGVTWKGKPGISATARLLFEARDQPELSAAVWIAAFCRQTFERMPPGWGGEVNRLLESIHDLTWDYLAAKGIKAPWNGNMRHIVPAWIGASEFSASFRPVNFEAFIHLMVMQATLSTGQWVLVHIMAGALAEVRPREPATLEHPVFEPLRRLRKAGKLLN